jgi:hypothetical protein
MKEEEFWVEAYFTTLSLSSFLFLDGVEQPAVTETTIGIFYQPQMVMDDECGVVSGSLDRGN